MEKVKKKLRKKGKKTLDALIETEVRISVQNLISNLQLMYLCMSVKTIQASLILNECVPFLIGCTKSTRDKSTHRVLVFSFTFSCSIFLTGLVYQGHSS